MIAVARLRPLSRISVVLGLVCLSCGGKGSDSDRPKAPLVLTSRPAFIDPGSQPTYDCNADQPSAGITLHMIEDWESGAGSGWYTNNDICEACQTYVDLINGSETNYAPGAADPGVIGAIDAGQLVNPDQLDAGVVKRDNCLMNTGCYWSQLPSYAAKPVPSESIPGGRCGSKYAFHVIAGPFTTWGGQLGINLYPPQCATAGCLCDPATGVNCAELKESVPVPGGPYDGISFWARVVAPGSGLSPGSGQSLLIQPKESHTDSKYPYAPQPPCKDNVGKTNANNTTDGCDAFGSFAILNNDWQFITLPFDEMRQGGWGKKAPYFDTQHLSNLTLGYGQGIWDIWIDDIAYYKRSAQ